MRNEQCHIIETAERLFSRQGARATTMDEIAHFCGISKKTLYQYFVDKETLVICIVQNLISENEQQIRISPGISPNAAVEMINFFQYIQSKLDIISPRFLRDMKKYYPDAHNLLLQSRNNRVIPYIKQNILRGISEDIYHNDLDEDATGWLYFWQLRNAMEEESLCDEKRYKLVHDSNILFLRGIMNAKGAKLMHTKFKQSKIEEKWED